MFYCIAQRDYNMCMIDHAENLGKEANLQVGSLTLEGRAFLAPMAGLSDFGMRRLAYWFGAALAFSEMIAAGRYLRGDRANGLKAEAAGAGPHAVQIAGCDPYAMAEAARLAEDCGAALIDINMGCPARRVTGGHAGSHLMRDLRLAALLVRATVAAVRIPVTLKMRLGWDERSINASELGRMAEAEGIAMLTVHGRTRCQFYAGQADWRAIGKVKQAVSIPVAANGDCASFEEARAMLVQSGADAVMIGRAAVGQPWFVGDVAYFLAHGKARPETPPAARKSAVLEHFEILLQTLGTGRGLHAGRKHFAAYAERSGMCNAAALRESLVRYDCPQDVRAALRHLFESPSLPTVAA